MGKLKGKKTYIVGGLTILGAAASFLVGDATAPQAAQAVLTAVLGMTIRNAIPE
jgi:precorrin-4 methylase